MLYSVPMFPHGIDDASFRRNENAIACKGEACDRVLPYVHVAMSVSMCLGVMAGTLAFLSAWRSVGYFGSFERLAAYLFGSRKALQPPPPSAPATTAVPHSPSAPVAAAVGDSAASSLLQLGNTSHLEFTGIADDPEVRADWSIVMAQVGGSPCLPTI